MPAEVVRHGPAVAVVHDHAGCKALDAAQHQPAFKRRENSSRSLLHECQLFRLMGFGGHDHSAQAVAVSVEEFGGGVHHHVGAETQWPLQVGGNASIVNNQFCATLVDDPGD